VSRSPAPAESLPAAFFDEMYRKDPDPWGFDKFEYERDKYAATLAALPRPRYAAAFEVGCSIGVLTRQLAERCGRLLAMDGSAVPLPAARARCADVPQVEIRHGRVPENWPEGETFDLILLSELLYFFNRADLAAVTARTLSALRPGGEVVLVHWLPPAEPPFPLTGDEAVEGFLAEAGPALERVSARRESLYRLDVMRRA